MMQPIRAVRTIGASLLLIPLLLAAATGVTAACAIDNTASLSADGVRATLTTTAATDPSHWAAFSFPRAFASGRPLRFDESRAELARTLRPDQVAAPYKWIFGDGTGTYGHAVTHRYARPGKYVLRVYGFDRGSRQSFPFDNALVQVVPPGQTLRANLGYYALRALDVAMSGLIWAFDAALVLLVAYVALGRYRKRRPRQLGQ